MSIMTTRGSRTKRSGNIGTYVPSQSVEVKRKINRLLPRVFRSVPTQCLHFVPNEEEFKRLYPGFMWCFKCTEWLDNFITDPNARRDPLSDRYTCVSGHENSIKPSRKDPTYCRLFKEIDDGNNNNDDDSVVSKYEEIEITENTMSSMKRKNGNNTGNNNNNQNAKNLRLALKELQALSDKYEQKLDRLMKQNKENEADAREMIKSFKEVITEQKQHIKNLQEKVERQ